MNFDGELNLLFKLRALVNTAYTELSGSTVNQKSAVPGFSNNRRIILLRGPTVPAKNNVYFDVDTINCVDKPITGNFPGTMALIKNLLIRAGAKEVGMITVAIMEPGAKVVKHVDQGPYYQHYRRFHMPLNTVVGSIITAGDKVVSMKAGEVWELNNLIPHSAENNGDVDRYHMIIDAV